MRCEAERFELEPIGPMLHVIDGYAVIILQMLAGVVVGTFGVLGKAADIVLNSWRSPS